MLAGRRRVRRRRGAAALGAAAVVTAVVVAVTSLGGNPAPVPQPVAQAPHPLGTEQVATVTSGLTATNFLIDAPAKVNDSTLQDTGLSLADSGTPGVTLIDAEGAGMAVAPATTGPAHDVGVSVSIVGPEGSPSQLAVGWASHDRAQDYGGEEYASQSAMVFLVGDGPTTSVSLTVGAVPSWLPDPRIALVVPEGFTGPDGSTTTWVELPTFRAPTTDGRLLYAFVSDGRVNLDLNGQWAQVLVVGSDGSTFTPQCPQGLDGCVSDGPELDEAAAALGTR